MEPELKLMHSKHSSHSRSYCLAYKHHRRTIVNAHVVLNQCLPLYCGWRILNQQRYRRKRFSQSINHINVFRHVYRFQWYLSSCQCDSYGHSPNSNSFYHCDTKSRIGRRFHYSHMECLKCKWLLHHTERCLLEDFGRECFKRCVRFESRYDYRPDNLCAVL